jgi:hypothetical protein
MSASAPSERTSARKKADGPPSEPSETRSLVFEWPLFGLRQMFDGSKSDTKSKVVKSVPFGGGRWTVLFYAQSGHEQVSACAGGRLGWDWWGRGGPLSDARLRTVTRLAGAEAAGLRTVMRLAGAEAAGLSIGSTPACAMPRPAAVRRAELWLAAQQQC